MSVVRGRFGSGGGNNEGPGGFDEETGPSPKLLPHELALVELEARSRLSGVPGALITRKIGERLTVVRQMDNLSLVEAIHGRALIATHPAYYLALVQVARERKLGGGDTDFSELAPRTPAEAAAPPSVDEEPEDTGKPKVVKGPWGKPES